MSQKNYSLAATAWMTCGALTALAGASVLGLALLPDAGGGGLLGDPSVVLSSGVVVILGCLVLNEGRSMRGAKRELIRREATRLPLAETGPATTAAQAAAQPAADPKPLPAHALAFVEELSRISSERATDRGSSESAVQAFIRNLSEPAADPVA